MDIGLITRALWVLVPFALVAHVFRSRAFCGKKDKEFNPLIAALVSGGIMSGLLVLMFSMPFLMQAIWDVRRVWWSSLGAFPSKPAIVVAALLLGLCFARARGGWMEKARWLALAPLAAWLLVSPPQSQLVELNRWRAPEWREGVCLQSTGFTCTPSAAATFLHAYRIESGESEMASLCGTTRSGTHVLGLARGLAAKLPEGKFTVRACRLAPDEVRRVHLPCITFTCCHACVIFDVRQDGTVEIGEGLGGRRVVAWNDFSSSFSGEAVVVTPDAPNAYAYLDGSAHEIRPGTPERELTMAGYVQEVDGSGRTLVRFGSAPIEKLMAESDGW